MFALAAGLTLIAVGAYLALAGAIGAAIGVPNVPARFYPRSLAAMAAISGLVLYIAGGALIMPPMAVS